MESRAAEGVNLISGQQQTSSSKKTCTSISINLAVVGELAKFVGTMGWIGNVIDVAFCLETAFMGLSWWAWGVGGGIALFGAAGSAYVHYALNKNYDESTEKTAVVDAARLQALIDAANHQGKTAISADAVLAALKQPDDDSDSASTLKWWQCLAIIGHFVTDMGEVAVPVVFAVMAFSKGDLSRLQELITHGAGAIAGIACAVAPVKTGAEAIRKYNFFNQGKVVGAAAGDYPAAAVAIRVDY